MSTDHIDDLFRRQLGDHATPPGDELWARLQAGPDTAPPTGAPAPERVDQLFQHRLRIHVTPPPRDLWERLEDEHLRPRPRRAAAWWPLAMAAAVALLLLAGGAGWWLGLPVGSGAAGPVAARRARGHQAAIGAASGNARLSSQAQPRLLAAASATQAGAAGVGTASAGPGVARASGTAASGFNRKNPPARATRPARLASTASKVGALARQSLRPQGTARQPGAAAPLVARTTAPRNVSTGPADEPVPAVASAGPPVSIPTPALETIPAAPPAVLAAANWITVDVRAGAARRPLLAAGVATAAAAPAARPSLGGRLLRQVGHAVRGERLSLSEMTGLPEYLTLEATIGGRSVRKSIQL